MNDSQHTVPLSAYDKLVLHVTGCPGQCHDFRGIYPVVDDPEIDQQIVVNKLFFTDLSDDPSEPHLGLSIMGTRQDPDGCGDDVEPVPVECLTDDEIAFLLETAIPD